MAGKRPTINDVARLAEVSKATVSAVINDTGTVKDSTRDKVLAAIEELNYRPSAQARRIGGRKSRAIGLLIKEIDNPYYAEVAAGARAEADKHGYLVQVISSEGSYDAERQAVELLREEDVNGLILTPVLDEDTDLSHLFELKRRNFPFVLLEQIRGVQASLIDIDNVSASRKAVEYLIGLGHSRIVHFAGPQYSMHSEERIDGVRRAFGGSSLVFHDDLVVPAGAHLEDGYRVGLEYFGQLQGRPLPTAVTCYNDLVALGLCRALAELGLRVPEDVSVVGYDDLEILDYLPVPLTSVHVPKYEMGKQAAQLLIQHIESREILKPKKIYLEAGLVVRRSTRSLREGAAEAPGDAEFAAPPRRRSARRGSAG